MTGTTLFPLNELQDTYPDLYEENKIKYEGRENLMGAIIPRLNCKWNDVLFFSTVHPQKVKEFLNKFGYGYKIDWTFYQIPIEDLDVSKIAILEDKSTNIQDCLTPDNIKEYDRETFGKYAELAELNKEYLTKVLSERGQTFHLFAGAVHVLYKGSIDVSKYEKINLI